MDDNLEAIRQRRMAELMARQGGGGQGGPMTPEEQAEQEESRRSAEEKRRSMLAAVLTSEARERLARIALVKPDKARGVENSILAAAQRGAISERVSDDQLLSMLGSINEREGASKPKITITRRRPAFDDDD